MVKDHRPRRGSLAVYPRKRAKSIIARIRTWVDPMLGKPMLLGFAGYKAGMAHALVIETKETSPLYGKEVVKPVTILDTPPIRVVGIRVYKLTPYGLLTAGEVWADNLPEQFKKDLERVFTVPESFRTEEKIKDIEAIADEIAEVRAIVATQPRLSGIGKKKPEVFEIAIGGVDDVKELLKYGFSILGQEVNVWDVFKEGYLVDVAAITKGKGTAGVIKRFGVKEKPRWHKHRKGSRKIGSVGPQKPAVMFTTPMAGQLGFHQRTEYNKLILKIGKDGSEITPKSGFKRYGVIRGPYVVLVGTVPGPVKRLIKLRFPVRPPGGVFEVTPPKLLWISTQPLDLLKE